MSQQVAIEVEERVAPGVETQEGVVAVAQDAARGKQGFDGGKAGVGIGEHLGVAGIGGSPATGDGAGLDGFDGLAHYCGMTPTTVQQEEWAAGIGGCERRSVGSEQEMT